MPCGDVLFRRVPLCRTDVVDRLNLSRLLTLDDKIGELEDDRELHLICRGDGDRLRLLDLFMNRG